MYWGLVMVIFQHRFYQLVKEWCEGRRQTALLPGSFLRNCGRHKNTQHNIETKGQGALERSRVTMQSPAVTSLSGHLRKL